MRAKLLAILLVFLMSGAATAAELFGTVEDVDGTAEVSSVAGTQAPLVIGTRIYVGQNITTGNDGEVHIVTTDSTLIALRPNSHFRVERYQAQGGDSDEIALSLFKGALRSITGWIARRKPAAYSLHTPTATIGVRGTDHETAVLEAAAGDDPPGTYDTVYEGVTVMQSAHGNVEVHRGESAYAARDARQAPALLDHRPAFMERRALRIEQRIERRKQSLHEAIQERMEARGAFRQEQVQKNIRREREDRRSHEQRKPRNPQ